MFQEEAQPTEQGHEGKSESQGDIVHEAARAALTASNEEAQAAARRLERMAREDFELYRALMDKQLSKACWLAVSRCCRQDKKPIWTPPNFDAAGNGARLQALAQEAESYYFDRWKLPIEGLPKLGDATKAQLIEAVLLLEKQAKTQLTRARFFSLIAAQLPAGKKVRDVFTEKKLAHLEAQATRGQ